MTISPTATFHPELHQEFHFAENSEVESTCCFCCFKSKPKKVKEYTVNEEDKLTPCYKKCDHKSRIVANQRLGRLIKEKFNEDPIENNEAFERLTRMINDRLDNGDPLTTERLEKIIAAIYKLKLELLQQEGGYEGDSESSM